MQGSERSDAPKSHKWTRWGALAGLLIAVGSKLKSVLPLLKLGKFGGTIWSMALMVGAYALIAPWTFAIGVVTMIFIHEMGHVLAAKRMGIPVTAPTFIPFLGALISMKKLPRNAQSEAYLAMGGPVVGTIGAVACFGLAELTQYDPLYAVAFIGFFLNLINLLPIHPLDGGRIVTAISRWLWLVGLIGGLLIIVFYLRSVLFFIIWAFFAWELFNSYVLKRRKTEQYIDRYRKTISTVDRQRFIEAGLPLPAEAHKRQLDFKQYCDLATQQHLVEVFYPGIGSIGKIPFSDEIVENVQLVSTKKVDTHTARMNIHIDCRHNPDKYTANEQDYYDVPLKTRIVYGLGYFSLAAFLILMMMAVFQSDAMTIFK